MQKDNSNNDLVIMPATYYYRWSTSSQVKEKQYKNNKFESVEKEKTIEEIRNKCILAINSYKGYCSKCNKEIRLKYIDHAYLDKAVSGRKSDREQIQQLIDDAEKDQFQVVITPFSSRLGRRRSATSVIRDDLKDLGIQIYSLHQPIPIKCPDCFDPMDDDSSIINETFADMNSELELASIRRNYKNGMPIRIKKGKPAGNLAYGLRKGYRIVGQDFNKNDVLEEFYEWDAEKIKIVQRIGKEFLDGSGTRGISQRLNLENIPSPKGKNWSRSAILVILKNPVYVGLSRWGWKITKKGKRIIQPKENWMLEKACFKGIWDKAYYEKIQDELNIRTNVGGRGISSSGLLIGLLKCGYCGGPMYQTRTDRPSRNYSFRGYGCGQFLHNGICKSNGTKQDRIDKKVLLEIAKLFNIKTKQAYFEKLKKTKTTDIELLLKQNQITLKKLNSEFERTKKAYREGVDTLIEYSKNKDYYEPKINQLKNEFAQIVKKKEQLNQLLSLEESYNLSIKRFLEVPTENDKKLIKVILRRLLERIEFKKISRKSFKLKLYYRL